MSRHSRENADTLAGPYSMIGIIGEPKSPRVMQPIEESPDRKKSELERRVSIFSGPRPEPSAFIMSCRAARAYAAVAGDIVVA